MTLIYKEKRKIGLLASMILCMCVLFCAITMSGCRYKKEPKPKHTTKAAVKNGSTEARKGRGQSDVPLRIGTVTFENDFNPFLAKSKSDLQVIQLTNLMLFDTDRTGRMVREGIEGEVREYDGKKDTYYGIAALDLAVLGSKANLGISIRDDLYFSDGEKITIDDVIFSMYVYLDTDYSGPYDMKSMHIKGLDKYLSGDKKYISGIEKKDEYSLTMFMSEYYQDDLDRLMIPVAPLHYYGDESKYDVSAHKYGHKTGDISSVCSNKALPMGGGAYRFVKCEDDVVYFMANDLYYKGTPKTAYLQLKDISDLSKDAAKIADEISGDTLDLAVTDSARSTLDHICEINTNGKLSGDTLTTFFVKSSDTGQTTDAYIYSTQRVKEKTLPVNLTDFYGWIREIETVVME